MNKVRWIVERGAAVRRTAGSTAAFAQADGSTVAFLMPDQASTRYEEHDYPGFQAAMTELCPTAR